MKIYEKEIEKDENGRSYYLKNCKMILISLVVIGHVLSSLLSASEGAKIIYVYIYAFHMPAFIFVSGYLAKSLNASWKKVGNFVLRYFLIYAVFQIVFDVVQRTIIKTVSGPFSLFSPRIGLWYLLGLISWSILAKLVSRYNKKVVFFSAVLMGLGIGLVPFAGKEFALSRTFVFLPFYLMGVYFKKEWLEFLLQKKNKIIGGCIMSFLFLICIFVANGTVRKILLGNKAYEAMGFTNLEGILYRSVWYLVVTIMIFAFFAIVPKGKIICSYIGDRTLQIFLIHSIICRVFFVKGVFSCIYAYTNLAIVLIIPFMMIWLFSNKRLTKLVDWPDKLMYTVKIKK